MAEGDQITCEIVRLEGGYLTVRTRWFGTVEIEWVDVASVVSIQYFDLVLSDGSRISGMLDEGARPGEVVVRTLFDELIPFARDDVFSIRQLGSTIWRSRRGHLNLGFDYSQADEKTQYSLDAAVTFHGKRFRWASNAQMSVSDDADSERDERDLVLSGLEIPFAQHFAWLARGSFERNTELDLDSRIFAGGGVGWYPVRSAKGFFGAGVGAGRSRERYTGGLDDTVTVGMVFVAADYHRFGTFGTLMSGEIVYLPSLSGPDRYRLEARGSLTQKLTSNFNISFSPYYSYDSRPPATLLEDEDWGWISSLGWMF